MAMFHLLVVTPDRKCFDGEAERIILRSTEGDVCIMANHIDYATALAAGEARITDDNGNVRKAACAGGMLSVQNNTVRVMATTFEWADEIDLARAEKARETAEERMHASEFGEHEYAIAKLKLQRALARISAGK